MDVTPLELDGAFQIDFPTYKDHRGQFSEIFKLDLATQLLGHLWETKQVNHSQSVKDVFRGLHFTRDYPGQAKWLVCTQGAITDFIVDLRVGSKTFGQHVVVPLGEDYNRAVFIPSGLGHGFLVTSETATVTYMVTATFNPGNEFSVFPLDSCLALPLPAQVILSEKDQQAPKLFEALESGILPRIL